MKEKFIFAFMDVAKRFSQLSTAQRLQVGCIIVKDDRIISIGYNGMPSGWTNVCEHILEDGTLKTKDEVIHAEANALAKLAKCTESGAGSSMFITHSPCLPCALQIHTAGIKEVYFENKYRNIAGIEFLLKANVDVWEVAPVVGPLPYA